MKNEELFKILFEIYYKKTRVEISALVFNLGYYVTNNFVNIYFNILVVVILNLSNYIIITIKLDLKKEYIISHIFTYLFIYDYC